jgi:hypothetical protein
MLAVSVGKFAVIRGPDPRIYLFEKCILKMDCRVKPGNDNLKTMLGTGRNKKTLEKP